jgi:polysaccharide export outer membrane protein
MQALSTSFGGLPSDSAALWRVISAVLLCTCACADLGKYVWVEDYAVPPAPAESGYVISAGDVLSVRVFGQEAMSGSHIQVRRDGKITLPFVNDVEAAGLTPVALAQRLESQLKGYLKEPRVTVSLDEPHKLSVSIVGEVTNQGVYQIEPGLGVMEALALAGGLTEVAHRDRIFVLREKPSPARIRFTFDALSQGDGPAARFKIQAGDVLVVE